MNFSPFFDKILVQKSETIEDTVITRGGLAIDQTKTPIPVRAKVLKVGPGKHDHGVLIHIPVNPGDEVLVDRWSVSEVRLLNDDGVYEDFWLVKQEDLLGKLE